jgi:four helix bundle protein
MAQKSQSFPEVLAWQKAHAFTLAVYQATEGFPKHEMFGLTAQLRPASVSIPANFVEGFRKRSSADKARFYNIAQGSADECLYHLILAHDLRYADTAALQGQLEEVSRLLQAYLTGLTRAQN